VGAWFYRLRSWHTSEFAQLFSRIVDFLLQGQVRAWAIEALTFLLPHEGNQLTPRRSKCALSCTSLKPTNDSHVGS
jgi:hypothetical protein